MVTDIAQKPDDKTCIAYELAQMQELLCRHGIVKRFSFTDLSTPTTWKQIVKEVRFNLPKVPTSTLPTTTKMLEVAFSAEIEGRYFDKDNPDILLDPLVCLTSFNIAILGFDESNKTSDKLFLAAWHLDRHENELNGGTVTEKGYMHPEYHITFGGKKMEEYSTLGFGEYLIKINYGNALILPAPRLPHPPMDVILGIDFIIQNFYPKESKINILEDEQYIAIIKNAQLRLWRPYFRSLASHWQSNLCTITRDNFTPVRLLPCLVPPNKKFS